MTSDDRYGRDPSTRDSGSRRSGDETIGTDPGTTVTDRPPSELTGEDLAIGYPTTDEPVVECDTVLFPAGEVTALVGPNGSGKSTLLKAMADQLEPEGGRVLIDGERVASVDEKRLARRIGLLSQENQSPASLTVEELVGHGRYPYRGFMDSLSGDDRAAIDRAVSLAGVEHLRDTELGNLSGGQKQLAWIAMVLAQDTDVLLLDEPTTFLDLQHQLRVMEVVRNLNREAGVTVGIVLHDVDQAARFADNLIAMKDGEPYDWGPPADVVTERLLADVFGIEARVSNGSHGPEITPIRPLQDRDPGTGGSERAPDPGARGDDPPPRGRESPEDGPPESGRGTPADPPSSGDPSP